MIGKDVRKNITLYIVCSNRILADSIESIIVTPKTQVKMELPYGLPVPLVGLYSRGDHQHLWKRLVHSHIYYSHNN